MAEAYTSRALDRALLHLMARGAIDRDPAGVSIGGCARAFGTDRVGAMRRSAHAHTDKNDPLRGWLCFKSARPERLVTAGGGPTRLLAHEWAHIAVWSGHNARWRDLMARLGHKADADRYVRKIEKENV